MYNFLLALWRKGKITEAEIRLSVGKYITQAQADKILKTKVNADGKF